MAKRTFGKVPLSGLRKRVDRVGENYQGPSRRGYFKSGIPTYNPKENRNCVRIVPPFEAAEIGSWGLDVHFHRNVGPNNDFAICNNRMFSLNCYICELQTSELWDSDRELAKSYYPDWRILVWVIDRMLPEDDPLYGVPILWSCPRTLCEEILIQSTRKDADVVVDISDPDTGRDVYFDRIGTGVQTKYKGVQIGESDIPLGEEVLEHMDEFSEVLVVLEYDEVKSMFLGSGADEHVAESEDSDDPRNLECYGKEYDKYEDCDNCAAAADCNEICNPPVEEEAEEGAVEQAGEAAEAANEEPPKIVPRKPRVSRPQTPAKPKLPTPKRKTNGSSVSDRKTAVTNKLKERIAKRQSNR